MRRQAVDLLYPRLLGPKPQKGDSEAGGCGLAPTPMPQLWRRLPKRRPLLGSPNWTLSSMMTQIAMVTKHTAPMRVMICMRSI